MRMDPIRGVSFKPPMVEKQPAKAIFVPPAEARLFSLFWRLRISVINGLRCSDPNEKFRIWLGAKKG